LIQHLLSSGFNATPSTKAKQAAALRGLVQKLGFKMLNDLKECLPPALIKNRCLIYRTGLVYDRIRNSEIIDGM